MRFWLAFHVYDCMHLRHTDKMCEIVWMKANEEAKCAHGSEKEKIKWGPGFFWRRKRENWGMYKYFYKINEPTSGKNENELQITCHRALARSFAHNSSCVCMCARAFIRLPNAIESVATIQPHPSVHWTIAPLNTCTHTHTFTRAQYISTDDFFSSFSLFYICTQLIRISHPEHL